MKRILLCLTAFSILWANGQENEKKVTVKTYGFIGFDTFFDSRISATARSCGYLYPLGFDGDDAGHDKNDKSRFDFTANISRVGLTIQGPDAFGAVATAKIEADFAGTSGNGRDFVFRLRQAFLNLKWSKTAVLVGQAYHPMFITENYPATVNFVAGVPFHPLSRAPQLRYTYHPMDKLSLSLSALSQGDFVNSGPADQVERSEFPEAVLQLKYGLPQDFFVGATFGVKQVEPARVDDFNNIAKSKLTTMHGNLSLRYSTRALTFKAEGIYGGNMTNLVMIGGLARKAKNGTALNAQYEAIRTAALWADIHTNAASVNFGVFTGITTNLGTANESLIVIAEKQYTRGSDIEKVYTVSPRVTFASGPVYIGLELNRTIAFYGADWDEKSKPIHTTLYANNRLLMSFRYNF
ncbi:hypothetical protein SAMN06265379_10270 [Saccharicrinis carchari]|uniref:Beta-barrel porin-2, OmpL-like. bbp2 n=1 Tax=Saccharicrinis carchari TaxID=1168039 RepID=A0A521BUH5_SACCC|nr:DcaP family trimeric outer membrane transporter [Saccharicrinis carchari]SMO50806.1 hypothetical protein SAMN06265379_10270 [Saccharicrinis carchari]